MAPSRGRATSSAARHGTRPGGGRTGRSRKPEYQDLPDAFQTLIAEAGTEHEAGPEDRPLKRRRIAPSSIGDSHPANTIAPRENPGAVSTSLARPVHSVKRHLQTVEASSDSDDSDFEFEDVDLNVAKPEDSEVESEAGIEDVTVSLESAPKSRSGSSGRRRANTPTDKAHRLLVHKLHILCLLGHCMYVNGRCNNGDAQAQLRKLVPPRAVPLLIPDTTKSQYQRNSMFVDGLQQTVAVFSSRYKVTKAGLKRPEWAVDGETALSQEVPEPFDRADFLRAVRTLDGSQDLGNQLFCALLRSIGLDARIVCSLQVLPFGNVPKVTTPQKRTNEVFRASLDQYDTSNDFETEDGSVSRSSTLGRVPAVRRRLGQPAFTGKAVQAHSPKKRPKPVETLSYPVFWVEVFNTAYQKWMPVDPIVTSTINKATKIEPPASYGLNQLLYAIAFDDDGVARDVTKRYAKAYNAKTRRQRVEASGDDGSRWWKRTMRVFRRRHGRLDRDQVEDAELAQKEARESLPSNVLDFKDHPYYALERHVKRHEVIHPKREVGKVNAGSAARPRLESVYRRQDVLICRSADKWYRLGRTVKAGEQPLKYVKARRRQNQTPDRDDGGHNVDNNTSETTGLYAFGQTELYVPPPVQRGRITKNAYGNLDIYAPSMVPRGGVHIRDNMAQQAARILHIDFADAVTGFHFKGRQGTAVIEGVVVAEQYKEAVLAVAEGLRDEIVEDESRLRSFEALKLWKRFLTGLRIAERVKAYGDDSNEEPPFGGLETEQVGTEMEGGGFLPGDVDETPMPTAGKFSVAELTKSSTRTAKLGKKARQTDSDSEGLVSEDSNQGSAPEEENSAVAHNPAIEDHEYEGGFVPEGRDFGSNSAGGFLPEAVDDAVDVDEEMAGGFLFPEGTPLQAADAQQNTMDLSESMQAETDPRCDFSLEETEGRSDGSATTSNVEVKRPALNRESIRDAGLSVEQEMTGNSNIDEGHMHVIMPDFAPAELQDNPSTALQGVKELLDVDGGSDGSVLSHDPEDEDAEPDWLESD